MPEAKITVFLADDNLIVREGVKALLNLEPDIEVVGTAADYDGLLTGAEQDVDVLRLLALKQRELLRVEAELEDVRRLRAAGELLRRDAVSLR